MATNTYVALATQTLSTATASVTFPSIDQTYTDLVLEINGSVTSGNPDVYMTFNGDSGSHYSRTIMGGNGSSALSTRYTSATGADLVWLGGPNTTANSWNSQTHIMNYANTTTYKTALTRENNASLGLSAIVNLWRGSTGTSTDAITSITITPSGTSWASGSTFTLYGIKAVGGDTTPKALGGIVTSDSTYYYHTFLGTSTFTPLQSLTADILVVAGGGGGGNGNNSNSGGGGAGGIQVLTSQSLTTNGYICIVGSGGANNTAGGNSVFNTTTSYGGGAGGNGGSGSGSGGSSGGTSGSSSGGGVGGGGTGGGGGGATANGTVTTGGAGYSNTIINAMGAATGYGDLQSSNYYFSGGGNGGQNGGNATVVYGGGGKSGGGSPTVIGTNGSMNTGGGGGGNGSGSSYTGYSGGSGIIIVRYLK